MNPRVRLPVICFIHPQAKALGPDASWGWHLRIAERVIATGAGWISALRLAGQPALRACITSYRTTAGNIYELANALTTAVEHEHPNRDDHP